ncbi:MAG TPA: RIP metalloprotease RseP [Thermoanaerobaculia bacterium]|jgi:regulator of sigma E protease|nr:RIP metalloprotease RseP [Thermoanaerobaculia bacterium]
MIDLLIPILSFVFALGVIIVVHEAGHLLVAKAFNVKVLTFSVGFGRKLWSVQRGETEYRVAAVPLGGYVRLGGENVEEATGNDPREFLSKPRWQRILVYLAGPVMNVILSIAIFAGLFMVGIEVTNLTSVPPVIGEVDPGSSAAKAGLHRGDEIVAVKGQPVKDWMKVMMELVTSADRPVPLDVKRGEKILKVEVTPKRNPRDDSGDLAGLNPLFRPQITQVLKDSPAQAAGFRPGDEVRTVAGKPVALDRDFVAMISKRANQPTEIQVMRDGRLLTLNVTPRLDGKEGRIGVGIGLFQRYSPGHAIIQSVRYNIQVVAGTFYVIGKIFTREVSAKSALSGPIGIAQATGEAARMGFKQLLYMMGLLSISIAVMNLLPIPILDGGQISILMVEEVIRRDLPLRMKEVISQIGFLMIILLMFVVIWFDLLKTNFAGKLFGS